jgi:CheY-like chemotaxis protein
MSKLTKAFLIWCADDEEWMHEMLDLAIKKWSESVTVRHFLRHDECHNETLRQEPDILIMDLIKDNVPGAKRTDDIDGFRLLELLASQNVKFPILVASGSLSKSKFEGTAKKFAGPNLEVFYITKPFTTELLFCALDKCVAALENRA